MQSAVSEILCSVGVWTVPYGWDATDVHVQNALENVSIDTDQKSSVMIRSD